MFEVIVKSRNLSNLKLCLKNVFKEIIIFKWYNFVFKDCKLILKWGMVVESLKFW